ncbi:MAG: IGHMBP2 family helicase [Halanaerobiales bacterium]|nr:IGHMBP2 family helicase [Halanaerobiales bacterium]
MQNIIIKDIDKHIGPGDIVGAFINEANISSNDIGNINIKDNIAEVEVKNEVCDKVINVMDNNKIGGVKVHLEIDDDAERKSKLNDYYNKYTYLVELERKEEMERHEIEIKRLSPREREKKGRALLNMRSKKDGHTYDHKPKVKFMKKEVGEKLPDTEISIGDLVMISKNKILDENNPTGTVSEKTNYSLTVVFDEKPPGFVLTDTLRVDLYVNDVTFQRMFDALEKFKNTNQDSKLDNLQKKLLGLDKPSWKKELQDDIEWINEDLNNSQKEAVKSAILANDFYLIQGPPGTGKTMTAIEIINQAVKKNKEILATADSNVAVDNLVERLVNMGTDVLRLGHPIRVTPLLRKHTLDYKILDHPKYKEAEKLREKADKLLDKQDQYQHPGDSLKRGMSDDQIIKRAEQNKGARGVKPAIIEEMAEWIKLQQEIDELFNKINKLEENAVKDLLEKADVVCATNSTAGSELLSEYNFDLIVIDEATQSTEPAALIPFIKGKKAVLIGDHKQLPPTILNEKAAKKGLNKSMFERLYEIYGKSIRSMLEIQYRMHDDIMNFSNKEFYNNKLKSSSNVANHTLEDLGYKMKGKECFTDKSLNPDKPIVFIDTKMMTANERSLKGSNSYDNPVEMEILLDIVDEALKSKLKPKDLAVIAPYKDQVDLFKKHNNIENLEINTVDGFQGREKEVVLISLVRSNSHNNIGFLRDLRRLNVALTRAKRKLIIIGDSSTIEKNETYKNLIDYIKDKGLYYQL